MKNKEPAQVHTEKQVRIFYSSEMQRQDEREFFIQEIWQALWFCSTCNPVPSSVGRHVL